ncbi:hypothetical protein EVAR_69425_1, partial [Eumeta japonica]
MRVATRTDNAFRDTRDQDTRTWNAQSERGFMQHSLGYMRQLMVVRHTAPSQLYVSRHEARSALTLVTQLRAVVEPARKL